MPAADQQTAPDAALEDDLALLSDAAAEAGRIAQSYFGNNPEVWYKDGKSPVSEADIAVDRFLKTELLNARPGYGWLSEETTGKREASVSGRLFVVDPIDGTRAFLKGLSTWCVSVALVVDGRPVAGVLACPEKGEVYVASAGSGARMNGRKITVVRRSSQPIIAGPDTMIDTLPASFRRSIERHAYVPSLAYRIAMVANGSLDATFVRPNAHDWDIAAADLVLQEAGGAIRAVSGAAPVYGLAGSRQGAMVAGSGSLLDKLYKAISD